VAHSYTPGLRVTEHAVLRRERRLPLKGEVVVEVGARVEPDTVVARTELPGNVQTVNLAAKLAIDPAKVPGALTHPLGSAVKQGELIAAGKSLFGLLSQKVLAPCDGVLESVSGITGQLIVREPPIPVEVNGYVRGHVAEVLPQEGVVVETEAALIQGIFGVGGETFGTLAVVAQSPDEELLPGHLRAEHAGRVIVGGSYVSYAALMKAKELGVTAVVVGGFDDRDLRHLLGKDLGVAITGAEELGFTLVLTEGFGRIRMAERTWRLLGQHIGHLCSVSGATQIRAGVMRPEILIPAETQVSRAHANADAGAGRGLEVGSLLRVIRQPYFGRIAEVVELPAELQELDTEAKVRVMKVEFVDDRTRAVVPRANVELIEP